MCAPQINEAGASRAFPRGWPGLVTENSQKYAFIMETRS